MTERRPSDRPHPDRQNRREQILEGLFEAMARVGTRGTSITEIAQTAGIARGALHYYFDSKEEIRLRLMERLGQRYLDGLSAYLDKHGPGGEAMARALVRYHFGPDDDELVRMLTVWIDFWGHAPSDPELNDVVLHVQERAREQCWRVIAAAHPQLCDLPEDAARAHAATLLALIEGAILQWRIAARSSAPFERTALSRAIQDAASTLVDALGHEAPRPLPDHSLPGAL